MPSSTAILIALILISILVKVVTCGTGAKHSSNTKPARPWPPATITVTRDSLTIRIIPRPVLQNETVTNHGEPWSEDTNSIKSYYRCPDELVESNKLSLRISIDQAIKEQLFSHQSKIVSFSYECFNEPIEPTPWWVKYIITPLFVGIGSFALFKKIKTWCINRNASIGAMNKTESTPIESFGEKTEKGTAEEQKGPTKDSEPYGVKPLNSWF